MTPTLETERLCLSPIYDPIKKMVDWLLDPINVHFSEQRHKKHTLKTQKAYLETFDHITSHIWLIYIGNKPIGTITAYRDMNNLIGEMGIMIHHKYASRGYGREAWDAVMDYLLETGMRKVEAGTRADNKAMRTIMEACDMEFEGQRERHFRDAEDEEFDLVQYGKMRWML